MATSNSTSNKCTCRQSTRELTSLVSDLRGFDATTTTVLKWRRDLAQEYCDARFESDPDGACMNNPYLPSEMIGPCYIYSDKRLRQIAGAIAARIDKEKTMGRRNYFARLKADMEFA